MRSGRKRKYTKENFWDFINRKEPKDCWPWLGPLDHNGYGTCSPNIVEDGSNSAAHRKAYILSKGPIPLDKPFVCHSCDNPACCNPDHLFVGNTQDNMIDMVSKNRQCKGGYRKLTLSPQTGSFNGNSKLTESQILEIRKLLEQNLYSQSELAKKYGVSRRTIYSLKHKEYWTHV